MTPIADLIGPLAEGVILLGLAPAAVLLTGMIAVSRFVAWRTERALASSTADTGNNRPGS